MHARQMVLGAAAVMLAASSLAGAQQARGSIADAVRAARSGDTIVVRTGEYREPTIVVDRPLTIIGQSGAVLNGSNATDILVIAADDVTVRGLTFRNVIPSQVEDRAAISVRAVRGCTIEDNLIENAFFGVYLAGTTSCRIANNTVKGSAKTEQSSGNGIHLWTARDIDVLDNRITGHRDGIYLEFVHDSRIRGNASERNLRYGLHFMYSDDCVYEHNVFRENSAGVAVMYTRRIAMIANRFEDNWGSSAYGLLLKEIYDSRLERNHFSRNTVALLADGATRIVADGNLFADNGWAVKLMASTQDGQFVRNTFAGNTFDVTTNSKHTTNSFRGNYWDEYRGYDLDRDGVGDVPHRPVRLFSLLTERNEPTLLLLRSPLTALLDAAERVLPSLTPELLADPEPRMRRFK